MIYERIALIGMGLIASSMALAARQNGLVGRIDGHAQSTATARLALDRGLADAMHETPEAAVEGADLVVLCTPLGTFEQLTRRIAPHLKEGATLSDVGSVKSQVVETLTPFGATGCAFHSGASNSRNRAVRSPRGLSGVVQAPVVRHDTGPGR